MSTVLLSRGQFALTIAFHFIFPPITIGLGLVLVFMQAMRLRTGDPIYTGMAHFWTKIFGLIFAIGVATGIPMEFQFGTNWANYARFVGDIFGSPLAIEGVYAFFLESGFLAILLFGWNKVGPKMHFLATCLVALGAHFSAIWIIVANSWMQTPAGYHLARSVKEIASGQQFPMSAELGNAAFTVKELPLPAGYVVQPSDLGEVRAVVDDFTKAILNPSTLDRLTHTIIACWIIGALVVASVSAFWILKRRHTDTARVSLKIGLGVAAAASLLQMISADITAAGVARHQPEKLAAMEGLAVTRSEAPMGIVGIVRWHRDSTGRITGLDEHVLRVPALLSILVSGDFLDPARGAKTVVPGLNDLPSDSFLRTRHPGATESELAAIRPNYWPSVPWVFQSYHLMISIGVFLVAMTLLGLVLWKMGRLWQPERGFVRAYLWLLVFSPALAEIATQAGWFTAEVGRQPWIVYQVLRTHDATSVVVHAGQIERSIVLFCLIYALLGALFVTLFTRIVKKGPPHDEPDASLPEKFEPLSLKTGRET
jgi:cytochrome d ubiquinol oxidase subunit I